MHVNASSAKRRPFFCLGLSRWFFAPGIKHISQILGIIVRSIQVNQDVFNCSYQNICDQSRRVIICTKRTTICIAPLTPEIYLYMFDSLVRSILTYGSEVWGVSKSGLQDLDRVSLRHMRWVLRVEATTPILAVYGGCGHPHPTPYCTICLMHHLNCKGLLTG